MPAQERNAGEIVRMQVKISESLAKIANNPCVSPLKRAEARYRFWQKIYIAKEAIESQLNERRQGDCDEKE
jgi:hypothetical protein